MLRTLITATYIVILFIFFNIPKVKKNFLSIDIWTRLFFLLVFFAATLPFLDRFYGFSLNLGIIKVVFLTALLFLYGFSYHSRAWKISKSHYRYLMIYLLFLFVFLTYLIIQSARGDMRIFNKLGVFMSYAYYPVIAFFVTKTFGTHRLFSKFLHLILATSVFMSLIGFLQFIIGPVNLSLTGMKLFRPGWGLPPSIELVSDVSAIRHFRVFSTVTDHQAYAAFLLLSAVFFFYFIIVGRAHKRRKYILGLIFMIVSLFTTYSLTAIVAIIAIIITYILLKAIFELKISKITISAIFIFFIIFIGALSHPRMNQAFTSRLSSRRGTVYARMIYFSKGIEAFTQRPLGYGFSQEAMASTGTSADNYWLWGLLQLGAICFPFYLLLYLYPLLSLSKTVTKYHKIMSKDKLRLAYLLLSFMLINALFLNMSNNLMKTGPSNLIFWLLIGVSINKSFWINLKNSKNAY